MPTDFPESLWKRYCFVHIPASLTCSAWRRREQSSYSVMLDCVCLDCLSQILSNPEWADYELQKGAQCGPSEGNGRQECEEEKKKSISGCRVRPKLWGLRLWGQEEHTTDLLRITPEKHWNWQFESVTNALPGEDGWLGIFLNCQEEQWHFLKWCHVWEATVVESPISEG